MNHQPFEDWLIEGGGSLVGSPDHPLTQNDVVSLHDHLQGCEECQRLAVALSAVETELRQAPVLAPRGDFSTRFQARLEAQQARLHRRQSLFVLGSAISGALLILGMLMLACLPIVRSSNTLFWVYLYQAAQAFSYLVSMAQLVGVVLRTAFGTIPWFAWVFGIGLVSFLIVSWVVSFRLVLAPRRVSL